MDLKLAPIEEEDAGVMANARVLSYNFNILPRGSGGHQHERIDTFLNSVDAYDVLLLQEVYSASSLPYAIQKRFCYKKYLIDGLKEKGFHHYVIPRQPSYPTVLRHNVISDNGLIIASRFPIWHRGSYTFPNRNRREQIAKGCLFAEVIVPNTTGSGGERIVFFNVHLRPEESTPAESSQVQQILRFAESVLHQLQHGGGPVSSSPPPFVIAGDFNIHGIEANLKMPAKTFYDLMNELQPLGDLREIVLEDMGFNPPTRPPKLFFPTKSKLERYESVPQRQDYFIVADSIASADTRLEKFVVSSRRPYTYLSDHFGISTTVSVQMSERLPSPPLSPSHLTLSSLVEEVDHERSDPSSSFYVEALVVIIASWMAIAVSVKPLVLAVLVWFIVRCSRYTISSLPIDRHFARVTEGVVKGTEAVQLSSAVYDPLASVRTLDAMWERAVEKFRVLQCLGTTGDMGNEEWLSFGAVDTRVRELGAGLLHLGLAPGDLIGVECEPCRNVAILELTCCLYGFATLPLAGKSSTVRALLDQHQVRCVFAGRSSVATLLTCRSTSLETIVHLHSFADSDDVAAARDLNISLIPFESIEYRGRTKPLSPPTPPTPSTPFTMSMNNVCTSDFMALVTVTHEDVLRDIRVLLTTSVLPRYFQHDSMLWFTPYASLFNRICVLGLLAQGNAIATSDSTHLQEAFMKFKPTLLVASPSLFSSSSLQLTRAMKRYTPLYNWMFTKAYQLRSHQIHVNNRDSTLARYLFFRPFQLQLGGRVRRIILSTVQETTPFQLMEHISVCYEPCVREVSYMTAVGVATIDGIPAPGLKVELKPTDELSQAANIGELAIARSGKPQKRLELAATWEKNGTLTLLGSVAGVLWPVDYQYAISMELERIFVTSRYVDDVFVYCEPLKPIVAVVYPNKDTITFEWQQTHQHPKQLSWTELVHYATELIEADLALIAAEHELHHSQVPRFVHLHPHAFRDHATFLTPFGRIRRENVRKYFTSVIQRLSNDTDSPLDGNGQQAFSEGAWEASETDVSTFLSVNGGTERLRLQVPVAIDIGGTFAKIAYISPPNVKRLKPTSTIIHEASSLSETLGLRTFNFFEDAESADQELRERPHSSVGTLRFAKIPSKQIPIFAEYLAEVEATNLYKRQFVQNIRATGGGAFKYASLARNVVGVNFEVVKEMDAVVRGLNLIIQIATESIFTVEAPSGRHLPHRLVSSGETFSPFPYLLINIGSGISFIKCLGPDGSHVRVGGSPIGGATFWGLIRTMTNLTSWEEVMEIMRLDGPGDNKNVDLLVGDIYGYNAKDLPAMLASDTVASTFGKFGTERFYDASRVNSVDHYADDDAGEILSPLAVQPKKHSFHGSRAEGNASSIDIVRSLLHMIASNVTQLAYLHSKIHGVKNIFFGGGFVRDNPIIWNQISATMQYWSSGETHAHFLEHDGYLGVLGSAVESTN